MKRKRLTGIKLFSRKGEEKKKEKNNNCKVLTEVENGRSGAKHVRVARKCEY